MKIEAVTAASAALNVSSFVPVAYFDKHMDCIRVHTHDRSVTEVRLTEMFTVHRCNHRAQFDPAYVGFTIKGVQHLFAKLGLPNSGAVRVAELLDSLTKHMPGKVATLVDFIATNHTTAADLVIDMGVSVDHAA